MEFYHVEESYPAIETRNTGTEVWAISDSGAKRWEGTRENCNKRGTITPNPKVGINIYTR